MYTNVNKNFNIENFMKTEYIDGVPVLDWLDSRLHDMVADIKVSNPYVYNGAEHLPNICYKTYGTTSLWRLVLQYNGFINPIDIIPGSIIMLPTNSEINRVVYKFSRNTNANTNQTVVEI